MKIAFLTTDNRDAHRRYGDFQPYFGPAPTALLDGFRMLGEREQENEKAGNPEILKSGDSENQRDVAGAQETSTQERRAKNDEQRTRNKELGTVSPFEIHVISCTQQPLHAPEKLASNIWYHSLHVPKIGWLRTGYQGCIRAVRRKLREINPDIVHGQGTERDCAVSAVFSGYPNVLTIHGNMRSVAKAVGAKPGSFHWMAAKLERFALARTQGVLCNSVYTRLMVEPVASKTWLVPNAIRAVFLEPPPAIRPEGTPLLLCLGTISPYKQQVGLLRVLDALHQRGLRFAVDFAGSIDEESPYGVEFLREIRKAETAGYARYLGNLPSVDLIARLDAASALVHVPSEEAFGLVVAEALARNLRIFGFAVGGMTDIIQGVKAAELVPPQDWEGLEESIARWILNGAEKTGEAVEVMRVRYAPETIARRHLDIYREVLDSINHPTSSSGC